MTNIKVGTGGYVSCGSDRMSFTVHEVLNGGKTLRVSYDLRRNLACYPDQNWFAEPNLNEEDMFNVHLCNRGSKKGTFTSNGKVSGSTYYVGHRSNYVDPHF